MGLDWDAFVCAGYTQEVRYQNCYSRFATRCLKLANPVSSATKKRKMKKWKASERLPGQELTDEQLEDEDCPFSETEEEVAAMEPFDRTVYDNLKSAMSNNHADDWACGGILNTGGGEDNVKLAFNSAVEYLLPGQGQNFTIEIWRSGGEYFEPQQGAKDELAYLVYIPTCEYAGGTMDLGRGSINMPWGHKRTPLPTLDAETAKQVDAAFAVLADKLGLEVVGKPGMSLITTSWGA